MKKKLSIILALVFAVGLIVAATCTANAWSQYSRVQDFAEVMTQDDRSRVEAKLNEYAEALKFDIVVVTCKENMSQDQLMTAADDFYDNNGYGYSEGQDRDGCILLVDFGSRNIWISTRGYGITALTDYGIQYLISQMSDNLGNGNYYDAFVTNFADNVKWMVEQARAGNPYDYHEPTAKEKLSNPSNWIRMIAIALVIGLLVGLIRANSNKSKLKSVRFKTQANSYVRKGSLDIKKQADTYLYSNVVRTARPKENSSNGGSSTHVSGSGATHGGGGGRF